MATNMKFVSFAFATCSSFLGWLFLMLKGWFLIKESGSLCCNSHPTFGVCNSSEDEDRCNTWCLGGCANGKGGPCKHLLYGGQCHCFY
ncbi:hypothetical protein ARALYDRAFT_903749 [Arabidopsis lyrata subsp. lyrata]|uniref:Uncharacterized protein n=1 Tax=Arabidopsis lyrata subsp. lyrata TaxID=81972 RepID=D7LK32_ARALL|nr:hypothetical protein ARALYDRAFT_903749 [Arabidopsis lyrata subsp. lyrata]